MGALLVCPECAHEWNPADSYLEVETERVVKDSAGNVLANGDTVTIIKDMKVKGSSATLKVGTKVRNIQLVNGPGDHDIDAKVDGFGPEGLILKNRLGGVLRYKDAARLFRLAATEAGLQEGQRMHVLRHTCVSLLISQGVNIKAIQAWVGHSSIVQTLDVYGHLFPDSMSELADKLDEYALLAASDAFIKMAN